jgi:glycosyltransferase involved in cell wall biosynthesis
MKVIIYLNIIKHWIQRLHTILSGRSIKDIIKLLLDVKTIRRRIQLLFPSKFGLLLHDPMVSILVVSYNSSKDLNELFPTLEKQYYTNFEVILVENGTEDNSHFVKNEKMKIKYIQSSENLGFATGNNIALKNSKGEFIALINPDTKVSKNWLLEMVNSLKENNQVAAIAPKIYFYTRYTDIIFESDHSFYIELSQLNSHLKYPKYFILYGITTPDNKLFSQENKISIRLPVDESKFELFVYSTKSYFLSLKWIDHSKKVYLKNEV